MEQWTIEKVKEELPDVKIKLGPRVFVGNVRGRKLKHPHVWVKDESFNIDAGWEFSWQAIVNSLNSGEPLIA